MEGSDADADRFPWRQLPPLAQRPPDASFGYIRLERGRPVFVDCSEEELAAKVADGEATEVAVPELDTLAPPSVVERLWPAVQKRDRRRRVRERKDALLNFCIFGALALYSIGSSDPAWQMVVLIFVLFGLVPLVQFSIGAARRKLRGEATFAETRERTLFAFWLDAGRPLATRACVWGLVGVFVVQVLAAAISSPQPFARALLPSIVFQSEVTLESAALVKPAVWAGEAWRLVTGALLHGGLLHIGFNALALANVGMVLERFYGRAVLLLTFLVSILAGSVASLLLMPDKPSVGASGGIMGLVGFLLVVGLRHRELPADFGKSIVRSVLFMVALGVVARAFIDNAAHAGGFVAGCLVAFAIGGDARLLGRFRPGAALRVAGMLAAGLLACAALLAMLRLARAGLGV